MLVALGVDTAGKRQVLGCSVSLSEAEPHWREFLSSLKDRGLHGIEFIVSDAHEGLKAARKAIFPSVPWQRCQFHLQQNAQRYVPRHSMKKPVAADIRAIFNAPDETEAKRLLEHFIQRYEETAPTLASWAESAIPEGFSVFDLPDHHRKRLRTSNVLERVNKEIKRRTRVATLFPNETSCLRFVTAVLMEISDEWETGRVYLTMDEGLIYPERTNRKLQKKSFFILKVRCTVSLMHAFLAAIMIASMSLAAEAQDQELPAAAQDVLVRYSSAFNQGDCDAMLEVASPEMISRLPQFQGGKEGFCEGVRHFHDIGIVDSLGELMAIKSEGPYRMAMVETLRVAGGIPGFVDVRGFYVLHSSDGGENWWVLDNSCVNDEWMKIVYPPYDGDPAIPGSSVEIQEPSDSSL